jgi:L-alanine-DL-glutamate epimerase-like enolase superfamily enzyme
LAGRCVAAWSFRRVAAVREAVGAGLRIMVDTNY